MQGLRGWYGPPAPGAASAPLALLLGEPGSGKSLLLTALRGALEALSISYHEASSFRKEPPLEPMRRLLQSLLGSSRPGGAAAEGEDGAARRWKRVEPFTPVLRRLLPDLPWPAQVPPLPSLGAELDRVRLCDVIAQTLAAAASAEPLVLLIENLHWLDPLSRDALAALLRIARARSAGPEPPRILVAATLRPGEAAGLEELLQPALQAFQVEVRGYSREDTRDCATSLGIDLPLTVRETLYRATGGNPFQVHFCLKNVRPPADPRAGPAPADPARWAEGFARFLKERLGRLAPAERRLLEWMAVLGRPASEELLLSSTLPPEGSGGETRDAEASGGESPAARKQLERLEWSGWVRREPECSGGPAWSLCGERIANLVLEHLSEDERSLLHRQVGERLLEGKGQEAARPWGWSGNGSWSEVFDHLRRSGSHPLLISVGLDAAREAEQLSASARAIEVHEQLLSSLEGAGAPALFNELAENLAALLEATSLHREAIEVYRKLLAVRSAPEPRARLLRKIGILHGELGEPGLAAGCFRDALELLKGPGESLERLKLWAQMALSAPDPGEAEEWFQRFGEGIRLLPPACQDRDREELLLLAEELSFRRGRYAEALAQEDLLHQEAARSEDALSLIRSAERLAHLLIRAGEPARARHILESGLERARASGNRFLVARFLAKIGRFYRSIGKTAEALSHLLQARDLYLELGEEESRRALHLSIAHLELVLCDFEAGGRNLREYAASAPPLEPREGGPSVFPPLEPSREGRLQRVGRLRAELTQRGAQGGAQRLELLAAIAEHQVDCGELADGSRLYEEALRSPDVILNPVSLARVLQRAGRLQRILGDRGRALRYYEKSLEFLGPVPQKPLVGNAYLEVASIFVVQGEMGKGYDFLLRGLRLFMDLEDAEGLAVASLRLGEFLREVGLKQAARVASDAAADLCRGGKAARWEAQAQLLKGSLASEALDFAESGRCFAKARSLLESLKLPVEDLWLELELGWECYRRANYPEALRIARDGLESARGLGMQDTLEDFFFLLGAVESELSNRSKNFLRALELLNQALLGAQNRGRPSVEAQVLLSIGVIYEERGKAELSREYRLRARSIAEQIGSRLPPALRRAVERGSTRSEGAGLPVAASAR
jgi:tetratricopeptide (TPR) repeat protein